MSTSSTRTSASSAAHHGNAVSSLFASPHFLRRILWLDAISGGATGILQLLFSAYLAAWLGLPEALLVETGWAMLAFTAGIALLATRQLVPIAGVWLLIAANAVWVLGCIVLLFGEWVTPTLSGKVFIAVQVIWVGLMAELQWLGLRRASATPW